MDYNKQCDTMLAAGQKWIAEHPNHDAQFEIVAGMRVAANDTARDLLRAMCSGVSGISGAQEQMVLSALFDGGELERPAEVVHATSSAAQSVSLASPFSPAEIAELAHEYGSSLKTAELIGEMIRRVESRRLGIKP